jgi:ribosomal protein S18 acetylase RimI-like enzyme
VHPRARGQGLGAAVTAWFVRRGFDAGAREVMLAVEEGNDVADRLYDRLGFDRWAMTGFDEP